MKNLWTIVIGAIGLIGLARSLKSRNMSDIDVKTMSFLGKEKYPRGIRNNNPGNLRRTSIAWKGKIPLNQQKDHGGYEQFYRYVDGVRAMILDITNDIDEDGLNTIRSLIYEYAPPSDNNPTDSYVQYVSRRSGIGEYETLDVTDRNQMRDLVQSMALFENYQDGLIETTGDVLSDQMFNAAWQMR